MSFLNIQFTGIGSDISVSAEMNKSVFQFFHV